jgi:hypothetical protein
MVFPIMMLFKVINLKLIRGRKPNSFCVQEKKERKKQKQNQRQKGLLFEGMERKNSEKM